MFIIDHFESDYAICETESGDLAAIPLCYILSDSQEGDVLVSSDGFYYVDSAATQKRREKIALLFDRLRNKNSC